MTERNEQVIEEVIDTDGWPASPADELHRREAARYKLDKIKQDPEALKAHRARIADIVAKGSQYLDPYDQGDGFAKTRIRLYSKETDTTTSYTITGTTSKIPVGLRHITITPEGTHVPFMELLDDPQWDLVGEQGAVGHTDVNWFSILIGQLNQVTPSDTTN